MFLRPLSPLLRDRRLIKLEERFRRIFRDLFRCSSFRYLSKLGVDVADYTSLFPGFALRGFETGLVELPAALWQDPFRALGGLDEEDVGFVGVGGDDTGDEAVACFVVTCGNGCQ